MLSKCTGYRTRRGRDDIIFIIQEHDIVKAMIDDILITWANYTGSSSPYLCFHQTQPCFYNPNTIDISTARFLGGGRGEVAWILRAFLTTKLRLSCQNVIKTIVVNERKIPQENVTNQNTNIFNQKKTTLTYK